ncbi:BCCT family transporter [Oceanobacillus profundus]|uniref:BCCT family transporter n=1 Tax=Oceanobacillus profundus TaxID=372463 RepID=A0A417YLY0_9BACI|nr:BCCT family transporter [Oceanobacillus profundus]MBR3118634.1 BCCT family transporter [Oceanobacillus sp.]PAE29585.1 glycine/betaine ABC transporter permease [Paenibacillus sp. 7884-2]MCM3399141.1 BCCT family transporter [Oceanobacillus profundus]MDO6449164.1 BCCT family transporter [Oceanobacillus profundus]RHW34507.1 BCCT family transporter [Oceanobacillus profundus]
MKNRAFLNPVFFVSAIVIFLLVIIGAVAPSRFGKVAETLFNFTTTNFGWFYLLAVFSFIAFLIVLAISKYGRLRLGNASSRPEYPFFTWIGMLFSTGFGSGLVFWGVAEPMSHFLNTPFPGLDPQTPEAARVAMGYAFFNWGISQWSVFAIVGLVIGYVQFRKDKNGLISTSIRPIVGSKKIVANTVDSFAVIATVMGVATSLGLGILQMNGGMTSIFGMPNSIGIQIVIALVMLITYLSSSITGLNKGMKWLSNINLAACLLLLLFVFFAGPTVFILETFVLGLGDYLTNFVQYSLRMTPYEGGTWVHEWTIFYWAWAISWSPFVGAFVARVSKGRTIREFIFGVLVVPPAIACLWIAVFGGTTLYSDLNLGTQIAEAVDVDLAVALFETFGTLPLSTISSALAVLLIFTFLVTSADSATYIIGSMTSKGSINPSIITKVIWGVLITAIAVVLLMAGGLEALQTASLTSALPLTVIILIMMIAFLRTLSKDFRDKKKR